MKKIVLILMTISMSLPSFAQVEMSEDKQVKVEMVRQLLSEIAETQEALKNLKSETKNGQIIYDITEYSIKLSSVGAVLSFLASKESSLFSLKAVEGKIFWASIGLLTISVVAQETYKVTEISADEKIQLESDLRELKSRLKRIEDGLCAIES